MFSSSLMNMLAKGEKGAVMTPDEVADSVGTTMRQFMSKLRDLKESSVLLDRAARKARLHQFSTSMFSVNIHTVEYITQLHIHVHSASLAFSFALLCRCPSLLPPHPTRPKPLLSRPVGRGVGFTLAAAMCFFPDQKKHR